MRGSKAVPQEEKPVRGELLTVEETCKKIRRGKTWLYGHIQEGTLPFPYLRNGYRGILIDSADIEEWQRLIKIPANLMPCGYERR